MSAQWGESKTEWTRPRRLSVVQNSVGGKLLVLILGPVLYNIFIKSLYSRTECTFSKLIDDTKLWGVTDTPDACVATLRDFNRLKNQAKKDLMKFNKEKCKVLHLRMSKPRHLCPVRTNWLESYTSEKNLRSPGGQQAVSASSASWWQRRPGASWSALGGASPLLTSEVSRS